MFKKIHLRKTDISHSFVNSGSLRKKQDIAGMKSRSSEMFLKHHQEGLKFILKRKIYNTNIRFGRNSQFLEEINFF